MKQIMHFQLTDRGMFVSLLTRGSVHTRLVVGGLYKIGRRPYRPDVYFQLDAYIRDLSNVITLFMNTKQ